MTKKRHHYVPKWYLKGFTDERVVPLHEPFLWVHEFGADRILRRAPKNLAFEIGYYHQASDDPDALENKLSGLESEAASGLRAYLQRSVGSRSTIPHEVGTFLQWLAARTPAFRRVVEEGWSDTLRNEEWAQELGESVQRTILMRRVDRRGSRRVPLADAVSLLKTGGWKAEFEQDDWTSMVGLQASYFGAHFTRLQWTLLTAPESRQFVTSDRPVVWFIPSRGYADSPAALRDPEVEVTVPLDRSHALLGLSPARERPRRVLSEEINARTAVYAERFIAGSSRQLLEETLTARSRLPHRWMHP